ncbi:hypothetical protein EHS25_000146 [Saitozyma podzolica]|uniref:Uncharacterized protein n=1 Tax=Saitozyma podzolica TaxID=1890683 RepID=A0A427YVB1_9TREE|nr:hypothetical protein EHS25_000146 [Saitozyma podzolica]
MDRRINNSRRETEGYTGYTLGNSLSPTTLSLHHRTPIRRKHVPSLPHFVRSLALPRSQLEGRDAHDVYSLLLERLAYRRHLRAAVDPLVAAQSLVSGPSRTDEREDSDAMRVMKSDQRRRRGLNGLNELRGLDDSNE